MIKTCRCYPRGGPLTISSVRQSNTKIGFNRISLADLNGEECEKNADKPLDFTDAKPSKPVISAIWPAGVLRGHGDCIPTARSSTKRPGRRVPAWFINGSQFPSIFPVEMATKARYLQLITFTQPRQCNTSCSISVSHILSDIFLWPPLPSFHANSSCRCAANLLQVWGTTGMLCLNMDCPAVQQLSCGFQN